jgi:hypothetical protein
VSDPIIIRVSSLTGYPDCPRRGAARLFWRVIRDAGFVLRSTNRGIGAAVGTAVHRAAALCFDVKAKTGELPSEGRAIDCAVYELADQIGHAEIEYDGPRGATHNRNTAEQQTSRMTRGYWRTVAPSVDPILVEERLEAEIAPGLVLSGQPDIVAREPGSIRDLKTGARLGSHAPQLGGYSLLARSHKLDITEASIDWVPRVPLAKPQPDPVSVPVAIAAAESAATNIIRHIESDLRTFREGDPARRILPGDSWSFLANPSSMLCAEKYCPCWGVTGPHSFCNEWRVKE